MSNHKKLKCYDYLKNNHNNSEKIFKNWLIKLLCSLGYNVIDITIAYNPKEINTYTLNNNLDYLKFYALLPNDEIIPIININKFDNFLLFCELFKNKNDYVKFAQLIKDKNILRMLKLAKIINKK